MSNYLSPFELIEIETGRFCLTLSEFDPVSELFDEVGSDGDGHAWEAVALHIVDVDAIELEDRVEFDSEQGAFCAYSDDRDALAALGKRLARLFHYHRELAKVIDAIGPRGFDY